MTSYPTYCNCDVPYLKMKEVVLSVGHLKPSKKFPHGAISNGSIGGYCKYKNKALQQTPFFKNKRRNASDVSQVDICKIIRIHSFITIFFHTQIF